MDARRTEAEPGLGDAVDPLWSSACVTAGAIMTTRMSERDEVSEPVSRAREATHGLSCFTELPLGSVSGWSIQPGAVPGILEPLETITHARLGDVGSSARHAATS